MSSSASVAKPALAPVQQAERTSSGYFRSGLPYNRLAEDQFSFQQQLARIAAPTLVIAGDRDPFYTPALFRETAAGIPNARLILYPGMGHPASGRQFKRDLLAFLREDQIPDFGSGRASAGGDF